MYFKLLIKHYILYNITSTTELLNSVSIDNSFFFIFIISLTLLYVGFHPESSS